jgi:hypothetical protein
MNMRRQIKLPQSDVEFLDEYGLEWETINDGSAWLLIHIFPTHEKYDNQTVTAAIRLETGYPLTPLDMVYFSPPLARRDALPIPATQTSQTIDGKNFQRWSRHRTAINPWRPGIDSISSHIILVEDWLQREFEK